MKRLIVLVLCINAVLLVGRFWQELPVAQGRGGGGVLDGCGDNPALYSIDANQDGSVDISDPVYLLNWLFGGGPKPRACLAQEPPLPADTLAFLAELRFGGEIAGAWSIGAPGAGPYAFVTFGADGTAESNDQNDFSGVFAPQFHSQARWTWRRVGEIEERRIRAIGIFFYFDKDGGALGGTSRLTADLVFSEDFQTVTGTLCERPFTAGQDPLDPAQVPSNVLGPSSVFGRRITELDPPCE